MNEDIEAEVERIWRAAGNGRDMIRDGMKFAYADSAKAVRNVASRTQNDSEFMSSLAGLFAKAIEQRAKDK